MSGAAARVARVRELTEAHLRGLAEVLVDCVDGGASVGFMHPLPPERAQAFWHRIGAEVEAGGRVLLLAEDAEGVVGTVQLTLDQPENQPHRADLSKLLVHRRARGRGIAAELMLAAEQAARDCGRTLVVLDTASPVAERLYQRLGWQRCGVIPDYALLPDGGLCATTIFYRRLDGGSGRPSGRLSRGSEWTTRS